MALRITPPGEDPQKGTRGQPVTMSSPSTPPGEDGIRRGRELENEAMQATESAYGGGSAPSHHDYLGIVRRCEQQSQLYTAQVNRKAWSESYRAAHNEHFIGSKYTRPEWRNRSKLFVPKTRGAIRKDMAATAASLFNSVDAINCKPGNEADPKQRAAASIMQELVSYRTDRQSGKAAFPWFLVSMGARQDATITGICATKQYWKQDFRKSHQEEVTAFDEETGTDVRKTRDVYVLEVDRPDMMLFPPENVVIDSAASWLNPAQSASFLILKYPMTVDEIRGKQQAPINPWREDITEAQLRGAVNQGKQDMEAIRRARELGLDRYDETQTGTEFQVVWVYENFLRIGGDDWTFYSIGGEYYLTDPKPTREVYPEQFGDRPVAFGFGAIESHRIFPMSAVESWQPLQKETNDLRNLRLDATKQNVMPISKVRRGRRIDMDQIKRRSSGSSIFVDQPDDVTWEQPPAMPQDSLEMSRELSIELDDLAGQQNFGNLENSDAVGKTLGGLRIASGAANAVQEFDIRVWIETWASPALAQIVRLEQYYESDPIVLGLCGQRAQLFEKHGIDKITDELLEQQVTVDVSVGLGAGDPQQRLMKFQSAMQVLTPLMQFAPEFQSGQVEINWEEMWQEVLGAVGYRDGGMRFVKVNQSARPNPMQDLKTQELQAKIARDDRMGRAALLGGLASVAKVALGQKELEADTVDMLLGHQQNARSMGFEHADRRHNTHLAALEHGHRHGMAIAEHRRGLANDAAAQAQQAGEGAEEEGAGPSSPPSGSPSGNSASSPPYQDVQFIRDGNNRIIGARLPNGQQLQQPGAPQGAQGGEIPQGLHEYLARLEAKIEKLSKPRRRRVTRDAKGEINGVEDEA